MEILTLTILTLDLARNRRSGRRRREVELCERSESGEDRSGDGESDNFEKRRVVGLKDQERV
ncbi:hypothetical protein SO802_034753 [Lithocarpus litseifolius]|uniref:Uncharacterized protein n=1 Tax=Lithocarpus litseifolius TaxID=425828 RepID=A0AAW2BII5_9ROSI